MIVITGGNTEFGRLVAGHLLDHLPAGQVTVVVREPRKAGPLKDRGYREHVTALGVPEAAIGMLLDYYAAVRSGWASSPTSDLAQLLPRAPASTIEAIRQAAAA